ncbi:spore germination protein KC [Halobacillus andaensis]|uniref:Spore germination protein KC n=1 Tax=Halobacillus andaensis TaxID=1176239 RepID=A0A917B514_HALAA|nr:Ger(x)C family spore germination protein [Halobacillus andaensis]MBP2004347.1 spore germination protein KC [Halobacillus andaensis]GGF22314.1 spore germination protein KC [Halobacillus andaensis]
MAKRLLVVFLMLAVVCALLTGCWDRKEMDDFSIVAALGIDKVEDEGRYEVTIELINPPEVVGGKEAASGRSSTTTIYSAKGDTLVSAIRRISQQTPRETFFPYTQVIIIGEELARSGIEDIFDLLERNQEFRSTPRVLIAKDNTAKNTLSILSPLEKIPAEKLLKTSKVSGESLGETISVKVLEFGRKFTSEGIEPLASGVSIIGQSEDGQSQSNIEQTTPNSLIKSEGVALFKKGKLVRWVDREEARGILYVINKIDRAIVTLDCNQKTKALSISVTDTRTTFRAFKTERTPAIDIHVKQEAEVEEVLCEMDVADRHSILDIEKQLEEKTKQEIEKAIEIAKEENSDVFGFGEAINRERPKAWRDIKKNYEEIFPELEVNIQVDAYVIKTGMRKETYRRE